MAEVPATPSPKEHTIVTEQARLAHLTAFGPSRRPIGRHPLGLTGAQNRHRRRHGDRGKTTGGRNISALIKDLRRIGIEGEPPPEEGTRLIDRPAEQFEPRASELRLKSKPPCGQLGRCPDESQHNESDENDLAPQDLGCVHARRIRRPLRHHKRQNANMRIADTAADELDVSGAWGSRQPMRRDWTLTLAPWGGQSRGRVPVIGRTPCRHDRRFCATALINHVQSHVGP